MTDATNDGNSSPDWLKDLNSQTLRTREEVIADDMRACEEFESRMEQFRASPGLVVTCLTELLADIDFSKYSAGPLSECCSRLSDFIQPASALKSEFTDFPLDVEALQAFYSLMHEYVYAEPSGYDPGAYVEGLDEYLFLMRRSLPLISDWVSKVSRRKSNEVSTNLTPPIAEHELPTELGSTRNNMTFGLPVGGHFSTANNPTANLGGSVSGKGWEAIGADRSEAATVIDEDRERRDEPSSLGEEETSAPLLMVSKSVTKPPDFAGPTDPIPEGFREDLKWGGNASDLLWKYTGTSQKGSKALLIKHKNKVVFVRKLSARKYELFCRSQSDHDMMKKRGPRVKSNSE